MNPARLLSLACLAAASGLEAQTVTVLAGGLGSATSTHSQSLDTTGGLRLGVGLEVEYLVVGGGGGGGGSGTDSSAWGSGGGGAGGMLAGTKILSLSSTSASNTFAVAVGAGGSGGPRNGTASLQQGSNGGNSSFDGVVAIGGGGGGAFKLQGNTGGSGGGGGGRGTGNNLRTAGGAGTTGQGFAGGASRDDNSTGRTAGGGGGGAGGTGGQGGTDVSVAGNGGLGLASSITGASLFYAAGGGGGAIDTNSGAGETAGAGGSSIGGNGSTSGNASDGAANTGSGGGGVGHQGVGGSGGSGIVVVRYRTEAVAGVAGTGGAVAAGAGTAEGYTVHQFTSAGSSALNLTGLDVANQRMVTRVSGAFTGAGSLQFNGTGLTTPSTFILAGNSSTHTGTTVINAGATVQVGEGGTSGSLGSGSIVVAQGAALVFDRSDDITINNAILTNASNWADAGDIVKRGAGTLTLNGMAYVSSPVHAGLVRVEEGSVVYDTTIRGGTIQVETVISEGASFVRLDNRAPLVAGGFSGVRFKTSGAGALTLKGTRSIALEMAVPGNPNLSYTSSLGHTGGTTLDGTGLFVHSNSQIASGSDLTIRGGGVFYSIGSESLALGSVLIESGWLSARRFSATSLEVQSGSLSGSITGSGSLLKTGEGQFDVTAASLNWSGAVRVEGGVLRVLADKVVDGSAITVAGGTLRLAHGSNMRRVAQAVSTLVLDGGTVDTTVANANQLNASVLDLRSGSISVQLVGKGALTKTTAGTVTLATDNSTYAGNVTVSEGTLRLLFNTGLGTASTVLLQGGTIELAGNTRVGYFEQTGGTVTGGTLVSAFVLTESGTFGSALADDVGGASGILKRTSGLTEVTAANTFTGGINVQAGTLRLAGAGAFNAASRLIASSGGTLDLAGKAQALAGIDGDGAIALGTGGALTVSSAVSSTFAGAISGDGSLTKSGTGTLSLLGANTHTGGTSVTGGTLIVNGTLGSGTVAVASGATLGGSGTVAGATVISGIHSPGNSPGIQTFTSSLTYQSGASIQWELAGQTEQEADRGLVFDGIDVAGNLAFSGPATVLLSMNLDGSSVDWDDEFWAYARSWKLFDVGGSVLGYGDLSLASSSGLLDSNGASLDDVRAGSSFGLSLSGGDIYLTYTAVPEPSAYGLALGALALAGAALRRRRASR